MGLDLGLGLGASIHNMGLGLVHYGSMDPTKPGPFRFMGTFEWTQIHLAVFYPCHPQGPNLQITTKVSKDAKLDILVLGLVRWLCFQLPLTVCACKSATLVNPHLIQDPTLKKTRISLH